MTWRKAEEQHDGLRVGFVTAENAQQVALNAQPIVQILQKELGLEVQPFVATDYTGVIEAVRANRLDVLIMVVDDTSYRLRRLVV